MNMGMREGQNVAAKSIKELFSFNISRELLYGLYVLQPHKLSLYADDLLLYDSNPQCPRCPISCLILNYFEDFQIFTN